MTHSRKTAIALCAAAVLTVPLIGGNAVRPAGARPLCTLAPGKTLLLLRVVQDTTLPFAPVDVEPMSMTRIAGPRDSLLARFGTPMPAGRVRLLRMDSTTRGVLADNGLTDREPIAFIRSAPYDAGCRTVRWTDSVPFVVRGEIGYVRGTLAPPDQWIGGVPLVVVPDAWNYPYPRRRGLAFRAPADARLAPAEALFSLEALLATPRSAATRPAVDSTNRSRAMAWARANASAAELEPARRRVRQAILGPDWEVAARSPSRLRGTYRVDLAVGDGAIRASWFFRTHDRPGYSWDGGDSLQSTAALIRSPYVQGYRLVGYAAASPDSIPSDPSAARSRGPLVWLATTDRPSAPGNAARHSLEGILEFNLAAAPEAVWNSLEPLVPPPDPLETAFLARAKRTLPRGERQPRIPIVVRLDGRGQVRADTSLTVAGERLRVTLVRLDTLSSRRPW